MTISTSTIFKTKLLALTLSLTASTFAHAGADERAYVSGNFSIDLDSTEGGVVQRFEGGDIEAAVVNETPGASGIIKKHLSNFKWSSMAVQSGPALSKPMRDWIKNSFDMKYARKNGAIMAADFNRDERHVREFKDALLTEIGFPALDGSAKSPGYLTIAWSPETVKDVPSQGTTKPKPVQKPWHPSNFRLTIEGLEKDCKKILRVDPISITWAFPQNPLGETRDPQKGAPTLNIPPIVIYIYPDAPLFQAWANDFIVNGNSVDQSERTALLELLDNRGNVLFSLALKNVGISGFDSMAGYRGHSVAKATLYAESAQMIEVATPKAVLDQLFGASRGGKGKFTEYANRSAPSFESAGQTDDATEVGKSASRGIASEKKN